MPTEEEEEAFSQLRARQGAGARYDAAGAPADALVLARRGTAYFARLLNKLADTDFSYFSAKPRWTRAHVVASVALNARDVTKIVEFARQGLTSVDLPADEDRAEEIDFAATLPPHALRNLFKHSEVHLNVEWRDLTSDDWTFTVFVNKTKPVSVAATPWLRARFLWQGAIDLDTGASVRDWPSELTQPAMD